MTRIHASATTIVAATPRTVYSILADYHEGHPRILPGKYFLGLAVERGGTGAGTRFRCHMRMLGAVRTFRAEVTEPVPGRVLVERIEDARGTTTTFTVDPVDEGRSARVTIATEWSSTGPAALVERLLAPHLLRRIYTEELRNLAGLADAWAVPDPAHDRKTDNE